jgi:flagellar basal-body rod protein FlgF
LNYGLQISASGALTALYRMDVLANNLANVDTKGFKPDVPMLRQRDPVRQEDGLGSWPSNRMLERLGAGVTNAPNRTVYEQGTLIASGNPFDLAIEGDGFFMMRDQSDVGADRYRLSRDGRLTRDGTGRLVSVTTGLPVMDEQNRDIQIPGEGQVQIDPDGKVRQNGRVLTTIQLVAVKDKQRLQKLGHGMMLAPADLIQNRTRATGALRQGFLEGSAVDAVSTMMAITDAGRSAESNLQMIQMQDRLMDRAINSLGRVTT